EALPGSDVLVDGQSVSLDASGVGAYVQSESAATTGPADESRILSVSLPYTVTSPQAARSPEAGAGSRRPSVAGTVSARVAVAPLRVDVPGPSTVIEGDHILVAGRAAKDANVTIDGLTITVGSDGAFEDVVPIAAVGARTILVRSGTSSLSPRSVALAIERVASLSDQAKLFEEQGVVGYDAAMRSLTSDADAGATSGVGARMIIDGDVIEPRVSGQRLLVLVDDKRGCAKGPCLARVVMGRGMVPGREIAQGDKLQAYGHIDRAFTTPAGQTVPELEAEFALRPGPHARPHARR
ncbi:MAG: hypothetical protein ACREJ3_12040, partial [Polyangiaceae bacterium]